MGYIFLMLGPSGSGKDTLSKIFMDYNIPELVSTTTRPYKERDEPGAYYYVSDKVWSDLFNEGKIVEWSEYSGYYYGITSDEIRSKLSKHSHVYCIVDIEGVHKFRSMFDNVVVFFVKVKFHQAVWRLLKRDGFFEMCRRIIHAIKTKEFSNYKYADFILDNTGSLYNTMKQFKSYLDKLVLGKIVRRGRIGDSK